MNIQVYAKQVNIEANRDDVNVFLEDIDVTQVVTEMPSRDVLEALSFEDVQQFYIEQMNENKE